jgi:hypothetical protein
MRTEVSKRPPFVLSFLFISTLIALMPQTATCQAPYGYHFVRTDLPSASVIYDSVHQQFFVSVPAKNQIMVVSGTDGSLLSTINITSPVQMDLSPDSSLLYVSTYATPGYQGYNPLSATTALNGFFVVGTTSYQVVNFVQSVIPFTLDVSQLPFNLDQNPTFSGLAAMSNGKLFYTGIAGTVSNYDSLFEYDPQAGVSEPAPSALSTLGSIKKSANASRFVAIANGWENPYLWVYDSASDSYIAHGPFPASTAIFSPDGTRILVNGHIVLDQNLNQIIDLWPGATYMNCGASAFSPDGTKVYCVGEIDANNHLDVVVRTFDIAGGAILGDVPAFQPPLSNLPQMAVSAQGLALILSGYGFTLLDVSKPSKTLGNTVPSFTVMSPVGAAESPDPALIQAAPPTSGYSGFYFGNSPGTLLGTVSSPFPVFQVQPPPAMSPGPVDVSALSPSGSAFYSPQAYTYGPAILFQDVDAGSVEGGTTVQLIGYGFNDPALQHVATLQQVTVGGVPAIVSSGQNLSTGFSDYPFPIEQLTFVTPPGPIGPADITLTTSYGSFTEPKGFQYISHALVPGLLPVQMQLDEPRGLLYVADAATGNVMAVDVNTLKVSTLLSLAPNNAVGLALMPDDSKLLVISDAGPLIVFDLNAHNVLNTLFAGPASSTTLETYAAVGTSRGTAIVGLSDTDGETRVDEVDLQTGDTTDLSYVVGVNQQMLLSASADGSIVYIVTFSSLEGTFSIWMAAIDGVAFRQYYSTTGFLQLSATALGDRAVLDTFTYSQTFDQLRVTAPNDLLSASRNLVFGEIVNSTGSLIYLPTTKGVELYDINRGDMRLSIGISGGVAPYTIGGLAIDSTGSTLYVAEASGLGIVNLGLPPLSIGAVTSGSMRRPTERAGEPFIDGFGENVTLSGSGFQPGAVVTIGGQAVHASVLSSTSVTCVVPLNLAPTTPTSSTVSPAAKPSLPVTITNPNGDSYTLPGAYNPPPVLPEPRPTLTSAPATNAISSFYIAIVGSGFIGSSQIMLDNNPAQTIYVDSQHLFAFIYKISAGQHDVAVVNAGSRPSNGLSVQVQQAYP